MFIPMEGKIPYMRVLDPLSDTWQVLYYDQLGCGNSPADLSPDRWIPELFVDELLNLIEYLNIKSYHIPGQSWGGMLGICLANRQPVGLKSLVLAGKYDQCTPAVVKRMLDHIENVRAVQFEESGHVPQFDETDQFIQVVSEFLTKND